MKKLLFLTIIQFIIISALIAQNPITYEEVIHVDSSLTKEDLYNRGFHFITSVFKNPQKVIQLSDKETGQIICKGNFEYEESNQSLFSATDAAKGHVNFVMKLYFKDGRYKYVFTDFIHNPIYEQGSSFGLITDSKEFEGKIPFSGKKWRRKVWNDIKNQIKENVKSMVDSLSQEMNKKIEKPDDW